MKIEISSKLSVKDWQFLHNDAGWVDLSENIIEKAIENSFVLCARQKNIPVGMARLISDKATKGLLCDVIVLKDYQKLGIGSILINEMIKRTKEKLLDNACFMIEALPLKDTLPFYIKNNFQYSPEIADGVFMILEK